MKKMLLLFAFCTLGLLSYSQDKTKKKVEKKTESTGTKIKNKADTIRKDLDKTVDSTVKRIYPRAEKVKD